MIFLDEHGRYRCRFSVSTLRVVEESAVDQEDATGVGVGVLSQLN